MKILMIMVLVITASCQNSNDKLARDLLEESMGISKSNLDIVEIKFGDKVVTPNEQKKALALFGLKDKSGYPITVTFKAKEDCVAVAEAVKNDVFFSEKRVSCRLFKKDVKPDLKFIASYKIVGFRQIAVYENGKLIKAGETFSARGELVHMTNLKDEEKSGTLLLGFI